MSLAVVDASVLVAFYATDSDQRATVARRLGGAGALVAPAHLDAEVVSALRGLCRAHPALLPAVPEALRHLASLPLQRLPIAPLMQRMWELRDNLTAYDAAYVALAERLDAPLFTCDGRLSGSSGLRCTVELIT